MRAGIVSWSVLCLAMGLAVAQAPIQNQWIPLKAKDLAYWDVQRHQWVVEDEKVNLMVGGSSADVKLQQTIGVKP